MVVAGLLLDYCVSKEEEAWIWLAQLDSRLAVKNVAHEGYLNFPS